MSNQHNAPTSNLRTPQHRTTLVVFLALLLMLLVASLHMISPYILALTMGGILAMLIRPVFRLLKKRRFLPKFAAAIVTTGLLLLVIVPICIFIYMAIKQGVSLGQNLAEGGTLTLQALIDRVGNWPPVKAPLELLGVNAEELNTNVREWLQNTAKMASGAVVDIAANLTNIALQLTLACIACYFFLLDGERFLRWIGDKVPLDRDVRTKIISSFKNTAVASIWATLAAGAAQSLVMFIAYIILGVPGAFLAAGATFIFAWIPVLGSTPIWLVGGVYLYTQDSIGKIVAMVVFGLIASVIDNIVRPIVLKGRSDMHPLISLVSIFGGIGFFGILGVFLGPILIAVLISLLQIWPAVAERFGLISSEAS